MNWGQLFDVSAGEMSVTVDMEPTASVEITIHRPDGGLLESGKVSASPNQKYYLGGSTMIGSGYNSLDTIERQMLPADARGEQSRLHRQRDFPFMEQPVIDGVATLRGLPASAIGANQAVLQNQEFSFPIMLGSDFGEVHYELKPGEVTKMEVTVVPHLQAAEQRKE